MSLKYNASTLLAYSPQKARLIINAIRGMSLETAINTLYTMKKGQSEQVYKLLKSAANNLQLAESDYRNYLVSTIVAEEAMRLYRVQPRARGSACRIRRRYSTIKVVLSVKENSILLEEPTSKTRKIDKSKKSIVKKVKDVSAELVEAK